MAIKCDFHEKLLYLRKRKNLTQLQLSEMLNVDRSTYSYYELGKSRPSFESVIKIALFYNVSVDYLINNVGTPTGRPLSRCNCACFSGRNPCDGEPVGVPTNQNLNDDKH